MSILTKFKLSVLNLRRVCGFNVKKLIGAGYYPLPKRLSLILSSIDPRYSAFIMIKARKTSSG